MIENNKFTVKYNYEDLLGSKYSSYDRHIIWKFEYLNMPIQILSRKDRKMLESYYEEKENKDIKVEEYSEGMYNNKTHNIIEYNKESTTIRNENQKSKNNISVIERKTKKDKYELHKMKLEEEKKKLITNIKNVN